MRRYVRVPLRVTLRKASAETGPHHCACPDGLAVAGQACQGGGPLPWPSDRVWEVIDPRIARASG